MSKWYGTKTEEVTTYGVFAYHPNGADKPDVSRGYVVRSLRDGSAAAPYRDDEKEGEYPTEKKAQAEADKLNGR